ncbi:lipid-A-disaccharide synthase [Sphingobacterium psychroaquaticum]|uniref:Lipid-A-disaccharide synthase n=1 Tax=Sphingobacterium psychroaquaticum TaxID=561061 RepID=A0A1X7IQ91_9SPHI|nr:lipid-A-disaccharide synthase [Sphingobacterium psychroaquaticum]QBQ41304.1 lipid-A-disaccharide synthase [Sphingobacterium psychroaquaticum]SMG16961.1 lipid-A-disaccharide synthase [Sphingobacterium psychroaquaticum]
MKYYIVAGETSGDLHGANLIASLKREDPHADFRIVGGDQMKTAADQDPLIHTSAMAFMGFVEVLMNLSTIRQNLKAVKEDIIRYQPDTLILIDFPGFNLKIAAFAKKKGIRVCYYISPKIWAWNQGRVHKIKKIVDHMLCILPFEVDFYKKFNYSVDYVGNPLLDAISSYQFNPAFKEDNGLNERPVIALLPGSRKMEIEKILPEMVGLYYLFPAHQFVIAGAPNFGTDYYQRYIGDLPIRVVFNQTYDLLQVADAAVVTSGTATLETGILKVPQVVVYKANALSIKIARLLVKVKFISLVNLINNFLSVRELIQEDCTTRAIADELKELINNKEHRASVLENYDILAEKLGQPGASQKAAKLIFSYTSDSSD